LPPWPFSTAELTAGLRRYFAEPALQVKSLTEQPLAAFGRESAAVVEKRVRGLQVEYAVGPNTMTVDCVVKEPRGVTRVGLASASAREIGIYRALASQLPMATPALVAADPGGGWLVLEAIQADPTSREWAAEDYRRAVKLLVELHERFWGLADDLAAFQWLARPLTRDYGIHVYAAAFALGKLARDEWPPLITNSASILGTLGQIISQADRVVQPLRAAPFTLLHGDFWAGNLLCDEDGDTIALDWQLSSIGPGVLDLLVFVTTSRWDLADLGSGLPAPEAELVELYRGEIARCLGVMWSDEEWAELWDCALMWRFMQETLSWLGGVSREVFAARALAFEDIWLKPVLAAAARRLAPVFAA